MTMTPKSRIEKGKKLEKWVAERLRNTGIDKNARREIGSGSGMFKGDIATSVPITFECKNTKSFQWKQYLKQAESASMGYQNAVVVWHPQNTPMENSKVFMSWDLFELLLKSFMR